MTTFDNIDHNVISFSGGKDSTAMLLLAIERDTPDLSVVFADTGNEHEQTYDYVRYVEQATGVAIRWVKAEFARQIAGKREFVLTKWASKWGAPQEAIDRAAAALVPTGIPFLDLCIWKEAMRIRLMWAAWRDRAALSKQQSVKIPANPAEIQQ